MPEKVYQLLEVDKKPEVIFKKEAELPHSVSLQKKEIIALRIKVNARGEVVDAKVVVSSQQELNHAALKAIYHWKYKPAEIKGQAVPVYADALIEFDCRDVCD